MGDYFNKSAQQHVFSEIRGVIVELNDGEKFCSITLSVGHNNTRKVNLVCKKHQFDIIKKEHNLGEKVLARYFISSRFKFERWYTMANILTVLKG